MKKDDLDSDDILFKSTRVTWTERIARGFVLYPKRLFALFWVVVLLQTAVVVWQGWFNIQETTNFDWTVADSDDSEAEDALADARTELAGCNQAGSRTPDR
jgi:hypothetical protein